MTCQHLDSILITDTSEAPYECAECIAMGDHWVHLRLCLTCGHVGCCDSSKNKHATKHYHSSGHPIVQSIEPEEDWRWCYIDDMVV